MSMIPGRGNAHPPIPPGVGEDQVPVILEPEAKYYLDDAKTKVRTARDAAKPTTTRFGRPAHKRGLCPNCPENVKEPLALLDDGTLAEGCSTHQYLYDAIERAVQHRKRMQGIYDRIKRGQIVYRAELKNANDAIDHKALSATERQQIRELGYIHKTVVAQEMLEFLRRVGFKEEEL